MPKTLWKTTAVIWTDFNPQTLEIDDLAREAMGGDAHCSREDHELVEDPAGDPDWDGTEFFGVDDDQEAG